MGKFWKEPLDADYVLKRMIQSPAAEQVVNGVMPEPYFYPKVFLWFPINFFPEFVVRCIDVTCDGQMKSAGQATFPRRCYGFKDNYYIFSQRLVHLY